MGLRWQLRTWSCLGGCALLKHLFAWREKIREAVALLGLARVDKLISFKSQTNCIHANLYTGVVFEENCTLGGGEDMSYKTVVEMLSSCDSGGGGSTVVFLAEYIDAGGKYIML